MVSCESRLALHFDDLDKSSIPIFARSECVYLGLLREVAKYINKELHRFSGSRNSSLRASVYRSFVSAEPVDLTFDDDIRFLRGYVDGKLENFVCDCQRFLEWQRGQGWEFFRQRRERTEVQLVRDNELYFPWMALGS